MAVTNKGGSPVLGLDIGAAFIKAVELRPSKGALAISGVGVIPTPPGCIVNDEIVDPAVLAAAVKQLLAESRIKTKSVMVSVAGQSSVVLRVIEVPKMTDKELAETMKWEIDRHIPFAPDEVVKDFCPIHKPGEDPESPNMSVLLAVAQNGVISGTLETILAAGLTPVAIDVESLAGARTLFDIDDSYRTETVALVNLGATKIDVGVYESGTLAFPRTIPVSGNAMTDAVARALNVELADAEHLKKQHGFVPDDAVERFGSKAKAEEPDQFSFGDFGGDAINLSAPLSASEDAAPAPADAGISIPLPAFGDTPFGGMPSFGEPAAPVFEMNPTPEAPAAPTFDLPDVGPANNGPIEIEEPAPAEPEPEPTPAPAMEVLSESERNRREISDAFMPVVAEMATEIKRSIEYYTSRGDGSKVDRVIVFGGVANLPGLIGFLHEELELPVQTMGLPNGISVKSAAISPEYLQQVSSLLPVAIGLSARNAIATEPVGKKKAA